MSGVKDSFDPTWPMPKPDDSVAGSYEAPERAGPDSKRPSVIQYAGDGTAELRSAAETKHSAEIPRGEGATKRFPKGVDQFDPINLRIPKQDNALKRGKFDTGEGEDSA